jgi:hypothetical protein
LLSSLPTVTRITPQGAGLLVEMRDGRRSDLASALVGNGLRLETLTTTQHLEDAFLELLDQGSLDRTVEAAP